VTGAEILQRRGPKSKQKKLNKTIEIIKGYWADGWVKKYEKEMTAL